MIEIEGSLRKMRTELKGKNAFYSLVLNHKKQEITHELNQYLSEESSQLATITIEFTKTINCIHCDRQINKSFNQGYCFPCFRSLASCDSCIMSPEKCHFHLGTCREPEWGEKHCMQDHVVYVANSSGLKVGLTRVNQIPTRWIDQGAVQALVIARVSSRYQAGLLEVLCKDFLSDKTNWRAMLKNDIEVNNLFQEAKILYRKVQEAVSDLQLQFNNNQIQWQEDEKLFEICYPVKHYPSKIKSLSLDKSHVVTGQLHGIKGQYLILDTGVINLRKHTGYNVKITIV